MKITEEYLLKIFADFRNSKYGEVLSSQVRYEIFKPDYISSPEWVDYLGPNGNNLEHMVNTYEQTKEVLAVSDLADTEKSKIYLAALIHDWGEAIVGDINYMAKTKNDEDNEKAAFAKILYELVSDTLEREFILDVYTNIAMSPQTQLGTVFNAIERVGYISDAFRMSNLIESAEHEEKYTTIFKTILNAIIPHQTEKLLEYSGKYNFVAEYLRGNIQNIATMLKYIDSNKYIKYQDLWASYK